MEMTKQEIAEELKHQQKMLEIHRKNLKHYELQEAAYGLNVPAHIISEIERLSAQIRNRIAEIDRLQTLAVEDQLPVNEAEYKMLLAEVWSTPTEKPSYVGQARLEHARLRLHITPARAQEIETEVRGGLAKETFDLNYEDFWSDECEEFSKWLRAEPGVSWESFANVPSIKAIRKIVALDIDMALSLLYEESPLSITPNETNVYALCWLFQMHRNQNEYAAIAQRLSQIQSFSHIDIPVDLFGDFVKIYMLSNQLNPPQ